MKRTSKSSKNVKQGTHLEIGVACMKNGLLRYLKDSTKEEKKKPHLNLAKPGARTKMVVLHDQNLQENDTNRELRLRGRRWYDRILIWRSRSGECKEEMKREKELFSAGSGRRVAGNESGNVRER